MPIPKKQRQSTANQTPKTKFRTKNHRPPEIKLAKLALYVSFKNKTIKILQVSN